MTPVLSRRRFVASASVSAFLAAIARPALARSNAGQAGGLERQTRQGLVRGKAEGDIIVFKGIPFAQAPVGALRLRPPQPKSPWSGVLETQAFRDDSLQGPFNLTGVTLDNALGAASSEDCLYLNIWAPAAPGPHPVLVWIYGGGNVEGGPSQPIYDGAHFARQGIICVTVGYRLGALGFLTLDHVLGPDYGANLALRDQIAGLAWVRDNIAQFGGNPARVTVAGESAGAKNVGSLLAIRQASGLFSQAIIESGSGQTVYDRQTAHAITTMFLQAARINPGEAHRILDLPPEALLAAQAMVLKDWAGGFPFRPVVDGKLLTDVPVKVLARTRAHKVRLLIGSNRNESSAFVSAARAADPLLQKELANAQLPAIAPLVAAYEKLLPTLDAPARQLRLVTAEEYWIPTLRIAEISSAAGAEVYKYRFDYATSAGQRQGLVVHTSELPFVWGNYSDPMVESFVGGGDAGRKAGGSTLAFYDDGAKDVAKNIQSAWGAFIRGGVPGAEGLPPWPRYSMKARSVMILDAKSRIEHDPDSAERKLWTHVWQ